MDCLFCKIINGEIPSAKVFENDEIVAFLDIFPSNPGHLLVVPKKHCQNLLDASAETLSNVAVQIPKLASSVLSAVGADSFNLCVNNGPTAGQVIPHLHFHIIPRFEGDGHKLFANGSSEPEKLSSLAEGIKKHLAI